MRDFDIVPPGSTIEVPFGTYAKNTGASITMTNLIVADIKIYKNGSTVERSSTAGITLLDTDGIDFDGMIGIHGFSIDLSNNADVGFYAAGSRYVVVVSDVNVDGEIVRFVAAMFRISFREASLSTTIATLNTPTSFTLAAGPAEDNAFNGCGVIIQNRASNIQIGYAVVQDYIGATQTIILAASTTFTIAAGDNIGIIPPTLQPTVYGRTLSVSASGGIDVDTIKTNPVVNAGTVTFPTTATLASTTNLASGTITTVSGNVNGSVNSVASAVTVGTINANAVNASALATDAVAEIADGVWDEARVGHVAAGSFGEGVASVQGNVTGSAGSVTAAVTVGTINANVVNASALATDAVAEIADGVWDEAIAGHLGAGTTGLALNSASSAGDPWNTALPGAYGAGTAGSRLGRAPDIAAGAAGGLFIAGSNAATTVNVTGNLTGNVTGSVGSVTGAVGSVTGAVGSVTGAVGSVTGAVGSVTAPVAVNSIFDNTITASSLATDAVAEIADGVWDEALAGHLAAGSTGNALNAAGSAGDPWITALPGAYGAGTAGNIVGANLNTTVSSRATQASVDAVDDFIDTEVAAIKAKTDNLPTSPAAVGSAMTLAADAMTAAALAADAVAEITAAIKSLVIESQGSYTVGQALSLILSAVAGITTNGGATLKTPDGVATRITAVLNANNERLSMTLNPSA